MFLCAFYDARVLLLLLLLLLLCVVLSEQKKVLSRQKDKKNKKERSREFCLKCSELRFFRFFVCLTTLFLILQNKKGILHNTFAALTPTPPTLLVQ